MTIESSDSPKGWGGTAADQPPLANCTVFLNTEQVDIGKVVTLGLRLVKHSLVKLKHSPQFRESQQRRYDGAKSMSELLAIDEDESDIDKLISILDKLSLLRLPGR